MSSGTHHFLDKQSISFPKTIDENAFIVEFDVNNVKGGVLRHYLDKKKNKILPKL